MSDVVCPICGNQMTEAMDHHGFVDGFECSQDEIWTDGDLEEQEVWWTGLGWSENGTKKFTDKEKLLRWWKLKSFE